VSDEKLKAAYSALPREEPGAAVDAAILAASRRALARPSASRRWAGPVSIAAVLVLAFGVTLRMQEEKLEVPDVYVAPPAAPVTQAPAARALEPTPSEPKPSAPVAVAPAKKVAPQARRERDTAMRDEARAQPEQERKDLRPKLQMAPAEESLAKESANVAQAPMPAAPAAAPAARMKREAFSAAAPAPAGVAADAQAAIDEPTRELEAIAKLRAEGRHEEADKALEEFRRKRPGYRIPEAMWERVKPR
jgi:hypothetical protein